MATEIKNVITTDNINILLDYFNVIDDRSDVRPDVTSKHPRWNVDVWPQDVVKNILDDVLDYDYQVDEVIFNQSEISFRLHADSGNTIKQRNGHAILIPLEIHGNAHTVFFDNYWLKDSTKFSKETILPYSYNLKNKNGEWQMVNDVRILLLQCETEPETVYDFDITEQFINDLHVVIDARNNNHITKTDGRTYDYTDVVNYNKDKLFPKSIQQEFISHISLETLNGLEIEEIIEWKLGNCVVFPRTQLHCASSAHSKKIGITIFTSKP